MNKYMQLSSEIASNQWVIIMIRVFDQLGSFLNNNRNCCCYCQVKFDGFLFLISLLPRQTRWNVSFSEMASGKVVAFPHVSPQESNDFITKYNIHLYIHQNYCYSSTSAINSNRKVLVFFLVSSSQIGKFNNRTSYSRMKKEKPHAIKKSSAAKRNQPATNEPLRLTSLAID